MESVVFDGKEYVKAAVLAERFQYTQDYLGQLCRAKKVDARLVGRAWYLNLDSLNTHRKARYKSLEKSTTEASKQDATNTQHFLTRIDVEPVLKKKTVKILKNTKAGDLNEYSVKYEKDDYSLIPRVSPEAVSKPIPVLPAEAEEVTVKNVKDSVRVTTFKAEPLPEVYLKGTLKVAGLPEVLPDNSKQTETKSTEAAGETLVEDKLLPRQGHQPGADLARVSVKKPIKIKLYRQASPEISKRMVIKPVSQSKTGLAGDLIKQPVTVGPKPIEKREIPVQKATEQAPAAEDSQKIKIQEIPRASLKALSIIFVCLCLASMSLLPKQELTSEGGSLVSTWEISTQSAQVVYSFLRTLIP